MKISAPTWNILSPWKYPRLHKMSAPRQRCSRLIIYDTVKMLAAYKRCWWPKMLAAENVGVQTLTIWARQNLHSVSFSVWLKISLRRCCLSSMQSPSGICSQIRSAYMGGVSAVLARLVVPARPVKMSAPLKCPRPPTFWPSFPRKIKNLARLISVLSLPFKFVQNHNSCPNSAASLLGL